jgi:hypothetical protein
MQPSTAVSVSIPTLLVCRLLGTQTLACVDMMRPAWLQEDLNNSIAARMLGYYIFWNLRSPSEGINLSEASVSSVAQSAGLNPDTTWRLLSNSYSRSTSLEDVVDSVEGVYKERKQLAAALASNQTVVHEVESAIWVALMVVLIFVTVAVFDGNTVQRTWTALSAAFLSFSFIFGNSIRQVCASEAPPSHPCMALALISPAADTGF